MKSMLIDSHVNLHAPQFAEDMDAVIVRARDAGVALNESMQNRAMSSKVTLPVGMWNVLYGAFFGMWKCGSRKFDCLLMGCQCHWNTFS